MNLRQLDVDVKKLCVARFLHAKSIRKLLAELCIDRFQTFHTMQLGHSLVKCILATTLGRL